MNAVPKTKKKRELGVALNPDDVSVLPEEKKLPKDVRILLATVEDPELRRGLSRAYLENRTLQFKDVKKATKAQRKQGLTARRQFWNSVREEYLAAALREDSLDPTRLLSLSEFARRFRLHYPSLRVVADAQNWKAMARFLLTARESDRKLYEITRRDLVQRKLLDDTTINEEASVRQRQAHFGRTLQLRGMSRLQDIPLGKIPVHIAADLVRLGSQLEREAVGVNPKESLSAVMLRKSQDYTSLSDAIGKQQRAREFALSFVKSLETAMAPALEEPMPNADILPPPALRPVKVRLPSREPAHIVRARERKAKQRKA